MRWWLARVRLWWHCFINLHEPGYFHHHFKHEGHDIHKVVCWKMTCRFCNEVFYLDRDIRDIKDMEHNEFNRRMMKDQSER